jgi:hypothetical protein
MAKAKTAGDGRRWIKNVTRDEMNTYIRQGYYVGEAVYKPGELHPHKGEGDNVGIYVDDGGGDTGQAA